MTTTKQNTTDTNCPCCPVQTVQITGYANLPKTTEIDDNVIADDSTWSSEKINDQLDKVKDDLQQEMKNNKNDLQKEIDDTRNELLAAIPVLTGIIVAFPAVQAPQGWLPCDGQTVSRDTHAALYAVVGDRFGAGDGTTTFNLPDLRGEFVRGWDNGRGQDTGRQLGSAQQDAQQKVVGRLRNFAYQDKTNAESQIPNAMCDGVFSRKLQGAWGGVSIYPVQATSHPDGDEIILDTSKTVRTAEENRPRNIALLYCIKA